MNFLTSYRLQRSNQLHDLGKISKNTINGQVPDVNDPATMSNLLHLFRWLQGGVLMERGLQLQAEGQQVHTHGNGREALGCDRATHCARAPK